ncbi:MAG: hypothetical protein IJK81_11505 [Selenomonadaceae bacterium]|nr:hypothetical protein [Selenomonadaceae bacterium]
MDLQNQIDGLRVALQAVLEMFENNTKALKEQMSKVERAEKLLEVAKLMESSPEKQKLLIQAANLINGKKLF